MKIAIIGGGICGLYLTWKLSKKGHKVTVFERRGELGKDICSGLFSERILEFIPESRALIQNKINSVVLGFPKKTVKVKFSKDFFVISHFELDRLVAGLCEKAGAEIILNRNVSSMPEGYDRIIGCDGADSFVRRNLGLKKPNYRLGILGFINKPCFENYVETWPCKNGFVWKIPRGSKTEYGILADTKEANKIFEDFLIEKNISLSNIKSKIVPQGFIIPSDPLITLCGDAVGLTKPWSGGGVVWGLTAAEILLKNFPDFLKYKRAMKRFFAPKIILARIALKLVYFLGFKMSWLLPKSTIIESDFLL